MDDAGKIVFHCVCGARVHCALSQAGKRFQCPQCEGMVTVPSLNTAQVGNGDRPIPSIESIRKWVMARRAPATFSGLLAYLLSGWLGTTIFCLFAMLFSGWIRYAALAVFLLVTVEVVRQVWLLLQARQRVLTEKSVPLLHGLVALIAWDPTEGIVVLRNKSVVFSDDNLDDGSGGVRLIFPVLGDEVALRVPLEVQTLQFSDENVLTQEYLSLTIRGTLKWRIADVRRFYLWVSREMRETSDSGGKYAASRSTRTVFTGDEAESDPKHETLNRLVRSSIEWLRGLAESQTRLIVSRLHSGLLMADRIAYEVPEMRGSNLLGKAEFSSGTEQLGSSLKAAVEAGVRDYGIGIEDVAVREVGFPQEVIDECVRAAKSAYLPLLGHRRAAAETAKLRLEVESLGRDAVASERIVGAAPAFALPDFINQVVQKGLVAPGRDVLKPMISQAVREQVRKTSRGEQGSSQNSDEAEDTTVA
jgi:regulator of protease activity HflC (stomatin/prohibitin superfamily)